MNADWVTVGVALIVALGTLGGVYAAIRADLAGLHARIELLREDHAEMRARLDRMVERSLSSRYRDSVKGGL